MPSATRWAVDLDETLFTKHASGSKLRWFEGGPPPDPIEHRIAKIRWLHEAGDYIIIHTARHEKKDRAVTEALLAQHNVPYDELVMDKPRADHYLDDKAMTLSHFDLVYDRCTEVDPKTLEPR